MIHCTPRSRTFGKSLVSTCKPHRPGPTTCTKTSKNLCHTTASNYNSFQSSVAALDQVYLGIKGGNRGF